MKILVCHPAQQHSYRLATALNRENMLYAYITTVYYKPGTYTEKVSRVLKGKFQQKAKNRHCDEIDDLKVIQFCEIEGLLKLLALNIKKFWPFYYKLKYNTADRFAKKVARYAIKNNVDAVITYDDCSPILFEILEKEAPQIIRILDMSAANLHYMKKIYDKDTKIMPQFASRLHKEYAKVWNEQIMKRLLVEIEKSQYFLVASNFVTRSLEFSGVKDSQILLCPYGVDISEFYCKTYRNYQESDSLEFIYVGGVKELKGISYLLEAFKQIPKDKARLTVIGAFNEEDEDIKPYINHVNFVGTVLHSEISKHLRNSDVFVFPSLGDGFGLAILEAMASGLPLIISENTGLSDQITNGLEGYVIPIQNTLAIIEKVEWYCDNKDKIKTMGKKARQLALTYTWDNYYKTVVSKIREVL